MELLFWVSWNQKDLKPNSARVTNRNWSLGNVFNCQEQLIKIGLRFYQSNPKLYLIIFFLGQTQVNWSDQWNPWGSAHDHGFIIISEVWSEKLASQNITQKIQNQNTDRIYFFVILLRRPDHDKGETNLDINLLFSFLFWKNEFY